MVRGLAFALPLALLCACGPSSTATPPAPSGKPAPTAEATAKATAAPSSAAPSSSAAAKPAAACASWAKARAAYETAQKDATGDDPTGAAASYSQDYAKALGALDIKDAALEKLRAKLVTAHTARAKALIAIGAAGGPAKPTPELDKQWTKAEREAEAIDKERAAACAP